MPPSGAAEFHVPEPVVFFRDRPKLMLFERFLNLPVPWAVKRADHFDLNGTDRIPGEHPPGPGNDFIFVTANVQLYVRRQRRGEHPDEIINRHFPHRLFQVSPGFAVIGGVVGLQTVHVVSGFELDMRKTLRRVLSPSAMQ